MLSRNTCLPLLLCLLLCSKIPLKLEGLLPEVGSEAMGFNYTFLALFLVLSLKFRSVVNWYLCTWFFLINSSNRKKGKKKYKYKVLIKFYLPLRKLYGKDFLLSKLGYISENSELQTWVSSGFLIHLQGLWSILLFLSSFSSRDAMKVQTEDPSYIPEKN